VTVTNMTSAGNLDLTASQGDVYIQGNVNSAGDTTISGKNVTVGTQGSRSSITVGGNATVTAGENATLGNISGKTVSVTAKAGNLSADTLSSQGDMYLNGSRSIWLNGRAATTGGNLTLESQGNIMQAQGVSVDGDLTYKLASTSKVSSYGWTNYVKGKTSGLPQ
jgi:hypothetical protein